MDIKVKLSKDNTKEIISFTQRLLGPVAEAADFLSDKIRFARWRSSVRILAVAKEIAEDENIEIKQIPLKFLVPFMDKSSLESESGELCETWARLLLVAVEKYDSALISYANILSNLDHQDVLLLQEMWKLSDQNYLNSIRNTLYIYGDIPDDDNYDFHSYHIDPETGVDENGRYIISNEIFADDSEVDSTSSQTYGERDNVQHLEYLGLIRIRAVISTVEGTKRYTVKATLTPLGYSFITACNNN